MDTILITGGAGFIGSTLANYLGKENKIVVVDDLSMGKRKLGYGETSDFH